jgi:hypothetical protein
MRTCTRGIFSSAHNVGWLKGVCVRRLLRAVRYVDSDRAGMANTIAL